MEKGKIRKRASKRCRVCRSRYREKVDAMLLEGKSYAEVSRILKREYEVDFSPRTLSRHYNEHVEKLILDEVKEEYEEKVDETVSEIEFLDKVRIASAKAIENGEVIVGPRDGIKATEVKLKYTEVSEDMERFIEILGLVSRTEDERLKNRKRKIDEVEE